MKLFKPTESDISLAHEISKKYDIKVHGSIWLEEWAILYRLVRNLKLKSILEIGSYYHLSSTALLKGIEDNQFGHLLSLDIHFPVPEFNYANVLWTKLEMSSFEIMPKLKNKFDLIFIDGAHGTKAVTEDIHNSLELVSENGIILMHDTNYPTTKAAIEDVLGDNIDYYSHKPARFHGLGLYHHKNK